MKNDNFFGNLKKMLRHKIIIKHKDDKTVVKDYDNIQMAKDINRYDNIYQKLDITNGNFRLNQYGYLNIKMLLFRLYELMDRLPIPSSILLLFSELAVAKNLHGDVLNIKSEDQLIVLLLLNLFYDILDVLFNLPSWVRNACKYGDCYLYLKTNPKWGITGVIPLSVYNVNRHLLYLLDLLEDIYFTMTLNNQRILNYLMAHFRILTDSNYLPYGKSILLGARKTWKMLCLHEDSPVWTINGYKKIKDIVPGDTVISYDFMNNTYSLTNVKNCIKTGEKPTILIITENNYIKCTLLHPIMISDGMYKLAKDLTIDDELMVFKPEYVDPSIKSRITLKITNIMYDLNLYNVWDLLVESLIHNFVACNLLVHNCLLLDAMLIHKIMRAPEKRIFNVQVGNLPPKKTKLFMKQFKDNMKKTPFIDPDTNDYNLRYNLMNLTEDFFIPKRGQNDGNSILTLNGFLLSFVDLLDYLRKKFLSSFRVPVSYLGFLEGINAKATLASLAIKFARTVLRIQRMISSELLKIALVHLYCHGYKNSELLDFEVNLNNPSIIYLQEKIALWQDKYQLVQAIQQTEIHSLRWMCKNILNMTDLLIDLLILQRKKLVKIKMLILNIANLLPLLSPSLLGSLPAMSGADDIEDIDNMEDNELNDKELVKDILHSEELMKPSKKDTQAVTDLKSFLALLEKIKKQILLTLYIPKRRRNKMLSLSTIRKMEEKLFKKTLI